MTDETTILGLRRVGPARPLAPRALDAVEAREGFRLPRGYRALLEAWGPGGQLCGFAYVLDPTAAEPGSAWAFFRRFMPGDATKFRRAYNHWRDVDDATWKQLVVWGDLDGKTLAWDTGRPDKRGEYPVYFLDREGQCAVRAGSTVQELVERFLVGGGIDRVHPPASGGHWQMTETYVTARDADALARLLAALRAGDEDAAEVHLAAHREGVSGYEASAQLLEVLLRRDADDLPPAVRSEWLERAARWVARCAPETPTLRAMPAALAALRAGRPLDELVAAQVAIDPACASLEVSTRVARWDLTYLDCVLRNAGRAPSAPCVLHAEAEGDEGAAPFAHELEIPAIEPGAEYPTSFGWPSLLPRRVRVTLRPA